MTHDNVILFQLTVTWRETTQVDEASEREKKRGNRKEMQFKIMDRNVSIFAPGLSAAVL